MHIYVIDSGIRMSHQDFGGRAQFAYDPWEGSTRQGNDCGDHGTRVASVAGGATYGVAKGATLWSVAAFDCYHNWASRVILAIDWVATNHASPAVANLSFSACAQSGSGSTGGEPPTNVNDGACPPGTHPGLDDAVGRLVASGVTTVVSAGNDNVDACQVSPARVPQAVTVAASGLYSQGNVTGDGRWPASNWGSCVDLFAPGSLIMAASHVDATSGTERTGTSMAAPHATGVVARLLQREPALSPAQILGRLKAFHAVYSVANAGTGTSAGLVHQHPFFDVSLSGPMAAYNEDITLTATPYGGDTGGHSYTYTWSYDVCFRGEGGCGPGSGLHVYPEGESSTFSYYFGGEYYVEFYVEVSPPGGGPPFARSQHWVQGY